MIWKQPANIEGLNALNSKTLNETLGIEMTEVGDDYLIAKMPVDERTVQPYRILHGGASVALAETLGSVASTLMIDDLTRYAAVGVEINANHLRPGKSRFVYGKVTPIHIGRKLHVWNIEIKDEQDKMVCISRLSVMIVEQN